jgi:isoamylase
MRNLICTLFFSQGVPMLCAGDEMARTQHGNNNAYCQDNDITWLRWGLDDMRRQLLAFTAKVMHYRRRHPNFHRRSFYEKDPEAAINVESVQWFRSDGLRMRKKDWDEAGWMRTLGMYLHGRAAEIRDVKGEPVQDDDFLLLLNGHWEPVDFHLPKKLVAGRWYFAFDTNRPDLPVDTEMVTLKQPIRLEGRSLAVLRHARS